MKKDFILIICTIVVTLSIFQYGVCTAQGLLNSNNNNAPKTETKTVVKPNPNPLKLPIINIK